MNAAARLLDRLEGLKPAGTGRWIAKCPAHPDRPPSLSIRETDDGRVLLKNFGGCGTEDVLVAIGLTFADQFPRRLGEFKPTSSRIPAPDLLIVRDHEPVVATLILNDVLQRRVVNESQVQRLAKAASRVGRARHMANPAKAASHAA